MKGDEEVVALSCSCFLSFFRSSMKFEKGFPSSTCSRFGPSFPVDLPGNVLKKCRIDVSDALLAAGLHSISSLFCFPCVTTSRMLRFRGMGVRHAAVDLTDRVYDGDLSFLPACVQNLPYHIHRTSYIYGLYSYVLFLFVSSFYAGLVCVVCFS